ncbi:hypothetical protein HBI70_007090 [Parastagonospora nodorum]|nr:hypothetical protein HBH53_046560 [Parastagonospora nodorum]KAH4108648.1 hypothetical protein HBH46_043550 [Parastagonospora nodorum]KAH4180470.1 hypothetical protein HBH43_004630 [Parastagonospora nodorum]KAH4300479.1 hypothetical protein HBI02_151840 [Parastagonospora nodorum]KAH4418944.1 hypothetical protein HBH92_039030 [Parastagonospora nodorum]
MQARRATIRSASPHVTLATGTVFLSTQYFSALDSPTQTKGLMSWRAPTARNKTRFSLQGLVGSGVIYFLRSFRAILRRLDRQQDMIAKRPCWILVVENNELNGTWAC